LKRESFCTSDDSPLNKNTGNLKKNKGGKKVVSQVEPGCSVIAGMKSEGPNIVGGLYLNQKTNDDLFNVFFHLKNVSASNMGERGSHKRRIAPVKPPIFSELSQKNESGRWGEREGPSIQT